MLDQTLYSSFAFQELSTFLEANNGKTFLTLFHSLALKSNAMNDVIHRPVGLKQCLTNPKRYIFFIFYFDWSVANIFAHCNIKYPQSWVNQSKFILWYFPLNILLLSNIPVLYSQINWLNWIADIILVTNNQNNVVLFTHKHVCHLFSLLFNRQTLY